MEKASRMNLRLPNSCPKENPKPGEKTAFKKAKTVYSHAQKFYSNTDEVHIRADALHPAIQEPTNLSDERAECLPLEKAQTLKGFDPFGNCFGAGRVGLQFSNGLGRQKAIDYLAAKNQYADRKKYSMPAAVLLDLHMTAPNGFEVLAEKQIELSPVTFVVRTASLRLEDVEHVAKLGTNSNLIKPASLKELVSMVWCMREWLRINHYSPGSSWVGAAL